MVTRLPSSASAQPREQPIDGARVLTAVHPRLQERSATPVRVSMTMSVPELARHNLSMVGMKCVATVQQRPPLVSFDDIAGRRRPLLASSTSPIEPGVAEFLGRSRDAGPVRPAHRERITAWSCRRRENPVNNDGDTGPFIFSSRRTLQPIGSPAAMNTTLGTVAATTVHLRPPCASRSSGPIGVSGTRPDRPRSTPDDTDIRENLENPRQPARFDLGYAREQSGSTANRSGNPPANGATWVTSRVNRIDASATRLLRRDPASAALARGDVMRDASLIISGRGCKINARQSRLSPIIFFSAKAICRARPPQHQRGGREQHFGALPSSREPTHRRHPASMPCAAPPRASRHTPGRNRFLI